MRELTKNQMLQALTRSENKNTAENARRILRGYKVEGGGFFNAVLKGDFNEAVARADNDNLKAFKAFNLEEEVKVGRNDIFNTWVVYSSDYGTFAADFKTREQAEEHRRKMF